MSTEANILKTDKPKMMEFKLRKETEKNDWAYERTLPRHREMQLTKPSQWIERM